MKEISHAERKKRIFAVIKAVILLLIVVGLPAYIIIFRRDIFSEVRSIDDAVNILRMYHGSTVLIYILLQIIQIVVSVLPGQVFQIAAGTVFGIVEALILSVIGAVLGTFITYYISRFLGADAMFLMLGKENSEKFVKILNSKKSYILVFILYLLPGVPKDLFAYAAGISEMDVKSFMVLSTAGRVPTMFMSICFGWLYTEKKYAAMLVMAVAVGIIMLLMIVFRKKLVSFTDWFYTKLTGKEE